MAAGRLRFDCATIPRQRDLFPSEGEGSRRDVRRGNDKICLVPRWVPTLGSHKTDPIHGVDVEKVDLHQGLNFCVWYGPASRTTNINIMLSPLEM